MHVVLRLILVLCLAVQPFGEDHAPTCATPEHACCCGGASNDGAPACACCEKEAPQPVAPASIVPSAESLVAVLPAPLIVEMRPAVAPAAHPIARGPELTDSPGRLRVKHCVWLV
jgi:hypothetical protein